MTIPKSAAALAAILLLNAAAASAQTYTLAPPPYQTVLSTSGAIVPNGCVWTYSAGTTTPIATYSDTSGTVNGNPIVVDSAGRFVAYLLPGTNYKFVYELTPCAAPSTHGTVLKTQDNIQGVPPSSANVDIGGTAGEALTAGQCAYLSDGSGSKTVGQWYRCDSANAYSSTLPMVGLPIAAIASATTGTFRIAGYLTGLSSLTASAPYYASSAAGSLTASAPANRRLVGYADTTTSIIITANPALMTAAASGTASSSTFLRGDQTWSPTFSVATTTSTGTQDNFAPGLVGNTILRCNNASLLTIDGFASGYDGQRLILVSIGAGQVDLAHQNAGSTAANRLINFATSASTSLGAGTGTAEYVYDATTARWRLVAHEQGAWITPTFTAGNFTGTAGTWTLTSPDMAMMRYRLSGRTLHVAFALATTTVTAATSVLNIANGQWGGYSAAGSQWLVKPYLTDNGTGRDAYMQVGTGVSATSIAIALLTGTFAASTDNTSIIGEIVFEVS